MHVLDFKRLNEYVNTYLQKVCELLNNIFLYVCIQYLKRVHNLMALYTS